MSIYLNIGKDIIKKLKASGHDAYLVGGYVRDKLIGIESDDIDITTSALPDEVINLFDNVKETGKKYGTVTVLIDSFKFEVTTFRSDGEYLDNRRPTDVSFSRKIEDDLQRRDFTINAIVMDEFEEVKDYFNSIDDLNNKLIRTINNPIDRFNEDALRILRAFRFVSKLGFDIETETLQAIKELRGSVLTIAIERVMVEINKIFSGKYRQKALKYLIESGVHEVLFGLKSAIEVLAEVEGEVSAIEVFIIANIKDELQTNWRFSNNNLRLIKQVTNLHEVTKTNEFNTFIMFVNKLEVCELTNKINVALGYKDQLEYIRELDKNLIIKDVCDLKFKGQDILWLTTLKKRSVIALVIDDLLYNVIMGIMPNDYDVLKEFALQRVDELQKEMGDNNE